ncbi:hypothetical protein GWN26_13580 [Candidatus Saccharibacteria bacterium]|nr:hypothetical protein [Candidatus Saccharibacteria bacterium]NIV04348.1 hypothetical protein [Calditrichia bacterium]NIS38889.1 hypothetical protein [Candidatus Saccharibacteria bacterium]NIV72873.1 hypothetical protein [Calditrichia bacterium]NIW00088.1 hypothetical protein [Candidatus Saccharibacteria bacterium]
MEITIDYPYLIKSLIYIGIGTLIVIFLLIIIYELRKLLRRPELDGLDRQGIKRRWEEIEVMLHKQGEMTDKVAILEADKLLDHVLKAMAMPGNNLGERLKATTYKYPKIEKVWWAHKIRNQIVHEASFSVNHRTAKSAVRVFEKALKELGVL